MLRSRSSAFFVVFTLAVFLLSGCSKSKPRTLQQVQKKIKDSVAFDKKNVLDDRSIAAKILDEEDRQKHFGKKYNQTR
ncbi:hypothetical protein JST56_04645 [Candidatus Dependentiae bacterium]|nr:hypothetical protein [Candidatus Dependentiae bacterium]